MSEMSMLYADRWRVVSIMESVDYQLFTETGIFSLNSLVMC